MWSFDERIYQFELAWEITRYKNVNVDVKYPSMPKRKKRDRIYITHVIYTAAHGRLWTRKKKKKGKGVPQ